MARPAPMGAGGNVKAVERMPAKEFAAAKDEKKAKADNFNAVLAEPGIEPQRRDPDPNHRNEPKGDAMAELKNLDRDADFEDGIVADLRMNNIWLGRPARPRTSKPNRRSTTVPGSLPRLSMQARTTWPPTSAAISARPFSGSRL
jgi:hypothetical protein